METLKTELQDGVFIIVLNRNEVRNAFNDKLIKELRDTFDKIANDDNVRVVVLRGEGKVFCAGGDLNWMKESVEWTAEQNLTDTRKLSKMFATLNACPKPVVGLVHGAAIGGGVGLVSICDYVLCSKETVFSLSEVRLGIIPACIGPFVLAKIGESYCRSLFMSAQRFDAQKAFETGLVHELVETPDQLGEAKDKLVKNLLQCGPKAMSAAKALIRNLSELNLEDGMEYASKTLADLRVSSEGQEGVRAFLEKRKPNWIKN